MKVFLSLLLLFFHLNSFAQNNQKNYQISGKIIGASTQEPILGVNIRPENTSKGDVTDFDGKFSFSLPEGNYKLEISCLGFETKYLDINLNQSINLNIELKENTQELGEIVITQDVRQSKLEQAQMSVNSLQAKDLESIPVVLGEKDFLKSLILLPGVSNTGEGAGGFNVRGGAADQNLVLLDGATLYNDSHLFGFFSVLQPDAIQSLTLYKGGIPSKFGNRVSSILNIKQKEGNFKTLHTEGSLGLVSSKILINGPIKKDKTSFLIGGRSSYAHLFLKLADNPNSAYFYDINAQLTHIFNTRHQLSISSYFGRDVFNINNSFKNVFGNSVISFNLLSTWSDALKGNLRTYFSDYVYDLNLDVIGFNYKNGITEFGLGYDLTHRFNEKFSLEYGFQSNYYRFNPGFLEASRPDAGFNTTDLVNKYAWQNAIYLASNQKIGKKLTLEYGARLNAFHRLGQDEVALYANNLPLIFNEDFGIYEEAPIEAYQKQKRNEIVKSFFHLEPRFSANYRLSESESIKASYQRINQHLHLISNNDAPTPLDIWAPSGRYLKPQKSDQWAAGYVKLWDNYSLETELFYKQVKNRVDYIDGANLIINDQIERVILPGEARSYGWELLFKKTKGKWQGWVAYTLSKSEQRTPGRTTTETGVNNGNWYNTGWDKTHDLSFVANYNLNERWKFNASFVYQTGRPTTYPTGKYEYLGLLVPNYDTRNANRLPDFHHLDFSATLTPKKNRNNTFKSSWVFSIYNVYGRKNAANISFRENEDSGRNEAVQLSIFGIVPAVAYQFKF